MPCSCVKTMGNSIGCVRPQPPEGQHRGAAPHSPKRRLRFRRKHKNKKSKKGDADAEEYKTTPHGPDGEENDDDVDLKAAEFDGYKPSLLTVPAHTQSNTLSPMIYGSRTLESSPKPSPAWKGVFCYPGEEDSVSAIVDVSSIPSQTTTTSPVNAGPPLGSTTPGGGRVLLVKGKVQGVVEKPWILRPKEEKKVGESANKDAKEDKVAKQTDEGTSQVKTLSQKERKGVVHIREVDGKLCVVRTVYPSDYGSPVWRGDTETPGDVVKVLNPDTTVAPAVPKLDIASKGMSLETAVGAPQRSPSLLESGYTSDLPLTSPGTTGTTPSQTDWVVPHTSSSERLDSVMDDCLSPQQQAATPPEV
ncbi:uncharacterized protein [Eucyclogobius newberryi]|uniref:uncharacterized protein n=1 Tax=Eucyclogobius newberryi TaxID=166745 RepID=UPI003B58F205